MTFNNPTISIIITTMNRPHLIERSIESILRQTYQDYEIIIVDSSTDDETERIVNNFQLLEKRIKFFQYHEKKGIAAARNFGIKNSKAEYIAFQDDDDEWLPDKIAKQMEIFKNCTSDSHVGIVYTGFYTFENGQRYYVPKEEVRIREGDIYKELLKGNFVSTQTMLIHTRCFEKVGLFNECLPSLEDWEFAIKVSKFFNFRIVDEPLVNAYIQPDSNSRNVDESVISLEIIINEHFNDFFNEKRLLSDHYTFLGNYYYSKGDMQRGRSFFIREFKVVPSFLSILKIFSSFFGEKMYKNLELFKKMSSR
jgi:glycosyltransferase involved in cell wall biosynthesis